MRRKRLTGNIVRLSISSLAGLAFLACAIAPAVAQEERGLAVGEKAPEFKLKDQAGEEVELAKLLETQNVALVFYRSANW